MDREIFVYKMIGSLFGWVWLISIPATLGFIVFAIFFKGSWIYFVFSFIFGAVGKSLLSNYNDYSEYLAIRNHLISNGLPHEVAYEICSNVYKRLGFQGVRALVDIGCEEITRTINKK